MFLLENPVLQRELLVNLRMVRAFVQLLVYVGVLGLVVYLAWPKEARIDLTSDNSSFEAQRLVNLFFLGQYVLMALLTPSFAAGTITGEKERRTYEMLLASPMRPGAILLGKLVAALCHLAVLVFCSLPIVMLCLPLGGVSPYEVLATYVAMAASVVLFGMISVAASSYFTRTIAAMVVSYLIVLPLTLVAVLCYSLFEGLARLVVLGGLFPAVCLVVCGLLFAHASRRLLHPPDVGAEAKDVVDPEREDRKALGMVIRSDQFPDKLFAPPKRTGLIADRINPVYDKELRSELFGQGTLMLRLVIQLSMFLALPLMAVCLFISPPRAAWYVGYIVLFNLLVGPVFSAGCITSERERETLELLLCTTLSPWQILSGKLISGLRVSCVLTSFLTWPVLLAWALPPGTYWRDTSTIAAYLAIIIVCSLTTTILAVFCSILFRKTTMSMLTTYLVLVLLFAVPVVAKVFTDSFFPPTLVTVSGHTVAQCTESYLWVQYSAGLSPLAAAFSLPLKFGALPDPAAKPDLWWPMTCAAFLAFYSLLDIVLLGSMLWLFNIRWRVRS
ncbi:MAG: ABC transporter permease subunit [Thermoguttaceae bacterium]